MAQVKFDGNEYKYFSKNSHLLFSLDNAHKHLFDYVDKDISFLPELFKLHISKNMDTTTFKLSEYENNDNINRIIEIIKSLHPYYDSEYTEEDILIEIGKYFNKLLVYSHFTHHSDVFECAKEINWYAKRFLRLIPSPWLKHENFLHDFYNQFMQRIDAEKHYTKDEKGKVSTIKIEESFILDEHPEKPMAFTEVVETQKTISNMLYFLLDVAAQDMENLTIPQRIWLYGNIFADRPKMNVTKWLYQENNLEGQKKEDIFKPLYDLRNLNVGRDGIPADMVNHMKFAVKHANVYTDNKVDEEYEVNSLRELLDLEIMTMIQSGTMIRKCKNCGKYFVVNNKKIAYCDRITKSGMPCHAVGSKQSYQRKMESEDELKIYNRAYKTHHARVRSGIMNNDDFISWHTEAKEKLEKVRSGNLDLEVFREWLKK